MGGEGSETKMLVSPGGGNRPQGTESAGESARLSESGHDLVPAFQIGPREVASLFSNLSPKHSRVDRNGDVSQLDEEGQR